MPKCQRVCPPARAYFPRDFATFAHLWWGVAPTVCGGAPTQARLARVSRRHACLLLLVVCLGSAACRRDPGQTERVPVGDDGLRALSAADVEVLARYLRSSPRWDVWEERGTLFAVRRERNGGVGDEAALEGGFRSASGGFYGDFRAEELLQTRVGVWFGPPPELGGRQAVATVDASSDEATVPLTTGTGQPGHTSWLWVTAARGALTLEVMEQSRVRERRFTRAALAQVSAALVRAKAQGKALLRDGHVPSLWPDGEPVRGAPRMTVEEGMQPGIYVVTAWVNPKADGRVFVRVRQAGRMPTSGAALTEVKAGQVLSEERVRLRSARRVGYSSTDADVLFPYQSEATVYEGDWGEDYGALFELVFAPEAGGPEQVLASKERIINGWMR